MFGYFSRVKMLEYDVGFDGVTATLSLICQIMSVNISINIPTSVTIFGKYLIIYVKHCSTNIGLSHK